VGNISVERLFVMEQAVEALDSARARPLNVAPFVFANQGTQLFFVTQHVTDTADDLTVPH
jgi:hypothetical protein